jgi:hypothetical protein
MELAQCLEVRRSGCSTVLVPAALHGELVDVGGVSAMLRTQVRRGKQIVATGPVVGSRGHRELETRDGSAPRFA